MHVTMVKKRLASGEPCEKCAQAEEMLRRRDLWERIDEVLWAVEGEADSPGLVVARKHGIELAPFFVVRDEEGQETIVTSTLRLVKQHLATPARDMPSSAAPLDVEHAARELEGAEPETILRFALEQFGERCPIAFSGGEEVVLLDMATRSGLPFRVFTLDTGRLHDETYEYLDEVRRRYGCEIEVVLPDTDEVTALLRAKGPNSFLRDGHGECCAIRKLRPLGRALRHADAWITGTRRDGRPTADAPVIQRDPVFRGASDPLVRFQPLAAWSRLDVFDTIRRHDVPAHPLFGAGYAHIGCLPCTRPRDESGAPDRWWWEDEAEAPERPDPGGGI